MSDLAEQAICHAAYTVSVSFQNMLACYEEPSSIYRPRLFIDGDQWCALYGENLQDGVAGFGDSPSLAITDFNKNWYKPLVKR